MKVAIVGLGNMGSGIASRILHAGHTVSVWNRTPHKMRPLTESGAKASATSQEAVRDADIVLTSLLDDKSVLEMVEGPNGFLRTMSPGAVHLCVTTISPECADRLSQIHGAHGTRFVSGPVAGRPDSAANGELITFLGGEATAIDYVVSVCNAYARKVFRMPGRPGLANAMKLCVNYLAVSIIEVMGEIYAFGDKSALDAEVIKEIFLTAFAAPALKTYASKIKQREFTSDVGFTLIGGLKDVRLMLSAAANAGVRFDIAEVVERKMLKAIDLGMADADWSGFTAITRQESGLY